MIDALTNGIEFSISRILLAIGVASILVAVPLISSLIDYTGRKVEDKSNMAEISDSVYGVKTDSEQKKKEEFPYLSASQVYFDIVNYEGDGFVQLISDTYVFDKNDIAMFRAGDNTSEAYKKITYIFGTFTERDRFVKKIDENKSIYEKVY